MQVQRRLRNGIGGNVSYSYSKLMDDGMLGGRGQGGSVLAQNWLDLKAERALSPSNQTNRLSTGLQFSSGQGLHAAALLHGWKAHVLKDWTVMTNVNIASGLPETPLLTSITKGTGISGQLRPEVVGAALPRDTRISLQYQCVLVGSDSGWTVWATPAATSLPGPPSSA